MICKNCGKEIADRSKFCPKCGTPVKQPEKIQPEPGEQRDQVCAGCGHPVQPGSKFCLKCGLRVGELPDISGDTEYLAPEEYGDETEVLMPQGERRAGAVISPSPPPAPMPAPPVPQTGRQNPPAGKKSRAGLFAALAAVLFIAACVAGICIYLFVARYLTRRLVFRMRWRKQKKRRRNRQKVKIRMPGKLRMKMILWKKPWNRKIRNRYLASSSSNAELK